MEKKQEKKWREEIRKQLELKEKFKVKEEKRKDEEQYSRIEYAQKEKIRREEEAEFYSAKSFVKIKNKYGETEWLPPEEAKRKKRRSKKRSSKKRKFKNWRYLWEFGIFLIAMIALYSTYKFFKNRALVKVKPGSVVVASNLPGAKIYLNGQYTNRVTPDTIYNLKPGKYWVVIDKKGYEEIPGFIAFSIESGIIKNINFNLKSSFKSATVIIEGIKPPFNYYIDGHLYGISNSSKLILPTGKHLLRIEKRGIDISPKSKWIIINENEEKTVSFEAVALINFGLLRITSNISNAFIFINEKNNGNFPSTKYFEMKPGNYSIRLAHPECTFTPSEKIIKITPGKQISLIFSGEISKAKGNLIITNCQNSQISIDGHLTTSICGRDTIEAKTGEHCISALNQLDEEKNRANWFMFETDSIYLINWNNNYKKWEKVN